MTMYVVSVCPVIVMGPVGLFAMVVMVVFAVVMLGRYPSIVMVMDVRVVSSTVAMVSRVAHGSKRKLLLSAAIARRDRSIEPPRLRSHPPVSDT
jgi:hypothetical protein